MNVNTSKVIAPAKQKNSLNQISSRTQRAYESLVAEGPGASDIRDILTLEPEVAAKNQTERDNQSVFQSTIKNASIYGLGGAVSAGIGIVKPSFAGALAGGGALGGIGLIAKDLPADNGVAVLATMVIAGPAISLAGVGVAAGPALATIWGGDYGLTAALAIGGLATAGYAAFGGVRGRNLAQREVNTKNSLVQGYLKDADLMSMLKENEEWLNRDV